MIENEKLEQKIAAYLRESPAVHEALHIASEDTCSLRVSTLARGEYNANYLVSYPKTNEQYVFRINLSSQMKLAHQIAYEARALVLLEESRRTPRLFFVDESKAHFEQGILIEQWLPGRSLRYESDQHEAAAIFADIHALAVPANHDLVQPENPFVHLVEECQTMFAVYRAWPGAEKETITQIDRWFERAEDLMNDYSTYVQQSAACSRKHFINTEVNSGNFLINKQGASFLVDWEKPLVGDVEQDLAHFLAPTTTFWKTDVVFSRAEQQDFLRWYGRAIDGRFEFTVDSTLLDAYLTLTCLRGITWSAMALAQHLSHERPVADSYTLTKIKTFLAHGFLDMIERDYYHSVPRL